MIEHFWQNIEGYFTFVDFYEWVAKDAARAWGGEGRQWRGVEVGVYTGQSAAHLGVCLVKYWAQWAHQSRLDLVDLELTKHRARENLAPLAAFEVLGRFLEMPSTAAAQLYDDASLDFVFIDANHEYDAVAADIDAWRPKVRSGGLLAGHDYKAWPAQRFGVCEAVNERFARFEVWPGAKGMGDAQMRPHHWPVWAARIP